MLSFTKVESFSFDSIKRRVVKFLRKGKSDIRETVEAGPYGIDSGPIKDMIAIYGPTNDAGQNAIIGYINKNQIAEAGEIRLYSTDNNGALKFAVHLKKDGVCKVDGDEIRIFGVADNLVKYTPLNAGLQNTITSINAEHSAIAANLALLNAAVNILAPGSVQTPYVPTPVTVNIAQAKNDKIKCQ